MSVNTLTAGSVEEPFLCPLCNKGFKRSDLQQRHRRRCKGLVEKRQTKRKSCLFCATSKLRCDLSLPSCMRCADRKIPCEYINPPGPTNAGRDAMSRESMGGIGRDVTAAAAAAAAAADSRDHFFQDGATVDFGGTIEDQGLNWGQMRHPDQMMGVIGMTDQAIRQTTAMGQPGVFSTDASFAGLRFSPAAFTMDPEAMSMAETQNFQQTINDISLDEETSFSILDLLGISAQGEQNDRYNGTGNLSPHDSMLANQALPREATSAGKARSIATATNSTRNSDTRSEMDFEPEAARFANQTRSIGPSRSLSDASGHFDINIEDSISLLCSWPRQLLDRDSNSPFVHNACYSSFDGTVPEPLAIALCCIASFQQVTPMSAPYVCEMINSERERLVSDFNFDSRSGNVNLAALQAMCVYQIIGLFGIVPKGPNFSRIKRAELHHPFFIKMARHMCQHHPQTQAENSWKSWALEESFRRTICLAQVINFISQRTQTVNPNYSELFGDELLLDLPMLAPESMWLATSRGEWEAARASVVEVEPHYSGTFRSFLTGLEDIQHSQRAEMRELPAGLSDLSRMVLASLEQREASR